MIKVKDFAPIYGNPTLTSLDGEERANLDSIGGREAEFGVYIVDTTPPNGKRWTGAFAGDPPEAVFEDKPPPTSNDVNRERDKRLAGTFYFGGKYYDCDQNSLARITGAATLAGFAMGQGAPAEYYRWHGGETDFAWIAADNSLTVMDAPTCFDFGQAAASNQSAHIFAAKAIKTMDPIPADYATNEAYWP